MCFFFSLKRWTLMFICFILMFWRVSHIDPWSVLSGSSSLPVRRSMQLNSHILSSIHWFPEWVITARSDERESRSLSVKTKLKDNCCAEILPSYICCSLTPRLSQHPVSLWITAALTGLWTQQQSVPERLRVAATGVITSPPSHVEWAFILKWTAPLE